MKILVTGGAGFIGSHVAERMLSLGHRVLIVDDLSSGKQENLPPGAQFFRCDIRSDECARLIRDERPEAVFHLAAQMDVRKSVADPMLDADINVRGFIRVLQAAADSGCRVVVFSSTGGAIYGEQERFPAGEDHPCRPVSPYGTSKYCGEQYLRYFGEMAGMRTVALRYANVYGPRQDPHGEAGVVAIFARALLQGGTPRIYGDGRQTRDFVFVGDVVAANQAALEREVRGVFNIGTGVETDVMTVFRTMAELAGFSREPEFLPERPGEQRRSVIDPGRAREGLGWRPAVGIREGLRTTLDYFRTKLERR
ncbi:MAG: SDR family oxidoreductase [Myxococcales bacterium]|nr:SDR family oxidoreductase [Myxococcales bacterium]